MAGNTLKNWFQRCRTTAMQRVTLTDCGSDALWQRQLLRLAGESRVDLGIHGAAVPHTAPSTAGFRT